MSIHKRKSRPVITILIVALICVAITIIVFFALGFRYISTDKGIKFLGKVGDGHPVTGILNYPSGDKARLDYANKTITFENGDLYTGDINGVYRDGDGTMQYAVTKDVYVGNFTDDEITGSGTYTYSNGDIYVGALKDGKMQGNGKITFASKATYEGNFNNNARSGYGIYTWATGAKYDGSFAGDVKNGFGKMTYDSGDYYEGQFVDDKRQGEGYYVWAPDENGKSESYKGNFVNNLIDTRKIESNGNFIQKADGTYEHGTEGLYTFGSGKTYKGYFEAGKVIGVDFQIEEIK